MRNRNATPDDEDGFGPSFVAVVIGALGIAILVLSLITPIATIGVASELVGIAGDGLSNQSTQLEQDKLAENNIGIVRTNTGVIKIIVTDKIESEKQFSKPFQQYFSSLIDPDKYYVMDMQVSQNDATSGKLLVLLYNGQSRIFNLLYTLGHTKISCKTQIVIKGDKSGQFIYRLTPQPPSDDQNFRKKCL